MNHPISTIHLISTICFLQDYMAANLETRPLSRLAVTNPQYVMVLSELGLDVPKKCPAIHVGISTNVIERIY